ncbi:MAG: hypothetical protein GWN61_21320 [candidate division Zixibacteria bacterium]|nr:hypothetical protein [Phycisphaerae bacterium]NIR66952.1 hypothetical protein [candidate division Zixibacteria bacterium]NIW48917.1 hypothetical protein [Gammaproteobacteria bacterium]NIS52569.1 hypothetical protein [Phycisphaerae bacterium]NIV08646.1 hypothetical protein [candidate division Zixibacteria bacterium]
MSKTRIKTFACLALLVGIVLVTSIVWASATEEPVNCEFDYAGTHIAKKWIDDDNVLHLRDITYWLNSKPSSGNIEIALNGVCNHNYDMNAGDGDFWGSDHSVEVTWGDLTGTFRGHHSGTRTNHSLGNSSHVYQGVSGDFVGWKLRLNGTWDFSNKQGILEGVLHNPKDE